MADTSGSNGAVQHPLTLVMAIRSPADRATLDAVLQQMQGLPPERNPIATALDTIGTVHFARFVFLDDTHLAVITTYDGDFDVYVNEFVDHVGEVFDALLQHIADAPPLPVREHRAEFLAFLTAHDLGCIPPFYSAYPERTVLDIRADSSS